MSSNVFWKMREVNYHDKLLDLIILEDKDVVTFESITDLVEDKHLISRFNCILMFCQSEQEKKWIENIFKFINDINVTTFNNILLSYSCKNGLYDHVKQLIEKDANVNDPNDSALKYAAMNGHLEIVKYLVEKGADIHAVGGLALKWAAANNYLEVVKYLFEEGAIVSRNGYYALTAAARRGHLKIVKYLMERPDCTICKEHCCHAVNLNEDGGHVLLRAATSGYLDVVKYLVEKGSYISYKIAKKAAGRGHKEVAKYLRKELERSIY